MVHETLLSLQRAARTILTQLVRCWLRHGVTYGVFSELTRQIFVEQGHELVKSSQGKATASAVAAITGLSRKEIKRLREVEEEALTLAALSRGRAVRVLAGWTTDPRFNIDGKPQVLSLDALDGGFRALVEGYAGDVTPVSMLNLLERAGCIEYVMGGVALMRNAYLPMATPAERLDILGTDTTELMASIAYNISCPSDQRVFQRKVSTSGLSIEALRDFQNYSNEKSQQLLEDYDQWLADRLAQDDQLHDDRGHGVSVGIYFYSDIIGDQK